MERKRLIAIIIIAIVIVGVLGWYFLFETQKAETTALAKVYIDSKDYTTPIIWNLTATPGATQEHNITNAENNATSMAFNYTIWHLEGNQWIEQWNGTKWFNGTSWLVDNAAIQPSIAIGDNITAVSGTAFANKSLSGESSTYYYSLVYNDQMIYLNLNYLGSNPTVDGQTVFAYVAFDGNGNGTLDASDKAFNFTNNPSLPAKNDLKIYTPASPSSWKTNATNEYSWNGNVSSNDVPTMPITVVYSDNRTNITFAIPFNYIGATIGGHLGFVLQAFGHDWTPTAANATMPAPVNYMPASFPLHLVGAFDVESHTTFRFYTRATFTSAASGDYSIIFKFQATIQNYS